MHETEGNTTETPARGRLTAVMLAGELRASPLTRELAVPVLCLPIRADGALVHAWIEALGATGAVGEIRIVVNDEASREAIGRLVAARGAGRADATGVQVVPEPRRWRGPGGIVRDVADALPGDDPVLVVEAHSHPPRDLASLAAAIETGDALGFVGLADHDQPAGVYALRRAALEPVPAVGFFDLKEQLLPALHAEGRRVGVVRVTDRLRRIRDARSYLAAVRHELGAGGPAVSPRAAVSPSAVVDGACVVEAGATLSDGAIVHDSVIMAGATVGGGAIVSQCLVGPRAGVPARARIVRRIVAEPDAARVRASSPRASAVG